MRFVKPRKPRGIKKDGSKSEDMCPECVSFGCDPFGMSPKFRQKMDKRLSDDVCRSCGSEPCKCKSRKGIKAPILVTGGKK